ncbi:UDP-2,3-diacylglucosamine diphosphatase [Runella sp.]|uniref:UDP-2,3-diacylglucosamine diphosphatase n=1 Tax=Runella sp. TaxID=1960881 RepID=UPI003D127407
MSYPQLEVFLSPQKKIYFASDFHLGAPNHAESMVRERRLVSWLESIRHDAQVICLVGDLFDFWYEHKLVVPRGFVRFMGKLGELTDAGIQIIAFPGNHDMWMSGYFEKELNIQTFRQPLELVIHGLNATISDSNNVKPISEAISKKFFITHGDGRGPGDHTYKMLQKVFESGLARWSFGNLLHPDWALWLGQTWANYSWRKNEKGVKPEFLGEEKEWLLVFAKEEEKKSHHDYYVFGHRHIELDYPVTAQSRIFILGDWIVENTYAVFDGKSMKLHNYQP